MAGTGEFDELLLTLAERRLAERVTALALLAFTRDELEIMPAEQRHVLDVLLRRRLRQEGTEPDVMDCLRIRLQFEQFFQNRFDEPAAMRVALQLR